MTPLSVLGARSFWALVISVAAQFAPQWIAPGDVDPLAGHIAGAVSAVAAVMAWYERRKPDRELVIRGPIK